MLLKTTLLTLNVQFWAFLEDVTSGGTKRCVDLSSGSIYSSCNTIHRSKISVVMDVSNLFGIPKIFKNLIF